jgi:lipopolysaccharide export system permease protein
MIAITSKYILRHLALAVLMISAVLIAIVFLTQSLRLLELVMEAGASGTTFWFMSLLVLPRFFEIILPIALAAAVIFIYQRLIMDSEIIVLRASGLSPLRMAQPALMMGCGFCVFLWVISIWLAPLTLRSMQDMQHQLKEELSHFLFQEGVFNRFGSDITVFLRNRNEQGELQGLIIHDKRPRNEHPVTITAQKGVISANKANLKITVFGGSRQSYNPENRNLNRLDFDRYTIDLPESGSIGKRWQDPEERPFFRLFNPDMDVQRDIDNLQEFRVEIHRRLLSPVLALTLVSVVLPFLLLGPHMRRGLNGRIFFAVCAIILIQAGYLSAFNLTRQYEIPGLFTMYALVTAPIAFSLFLLSKWGEQSRRILLYNYERAEP